MSKDRECGIAPPTGQWKILRDTFLDNDPSPVYRLVWGLYDTRGCRVTRINIQTIRRDTHELHSQREVTL